MCYIDNLVMKNCRLINTMLAFEYSTVDAEVNSTIDSVLNPSGGRIQAERIKELIMEGDKVDVSKTVIQTQEPGNTLELPPEQALKTFNLAGLQTAAVVVPNENLRHRINRALNTDEVAEPNAFAIDATIAAFTGGDDWLDALRSYLAENRQTVRAFLEKELPEVSLVPSHATYLLWLDCSRVIGDASELCRYLRMETGLYLSEGAVYGGHGNQFLRMNAACPRTRIEDGLNRLKKGVRAYEQYVAESC